MLVTLQAPPNDTFRGFLVQALASGTDDVTGTFFTTDHKYLNCGKGINNAVTHRGSSPKKKVRLMWEPPSDFVGDVVFTGCFVNEKIIFWVDVTSEKVTVVKREVAVAPPPPTTTSTSTTTTTTTTSTTTTTTKPFVSSDIGALSPENAGDTVISVVDAPSADVVENDISVANPEDNSIPSSTVASAPTSVSTSTVSVSTSNNPSSPVSENSTDSSSNSPVGTGEGKDVAEGADDVAEEDEGNGEDTAEEPVVTGGSTRTKPTRRRFGLFGRFKTTTKAPTTTSTAAVTTESTTAPSILSEEYPPEIQSLALKLVNIYDSCGEKKGCFGFPSGCEEKKNCVMMMTYTKVSSGYKFEIMGTTSSGYVAAGLSDDNTMGKDSVMACRVLNGEADVLMAYNNGKSNELLTNSKYGLSNIQTLQVDGKVYCTFVRQAHTDMAGVNFDLDSERFHLMLAMGPAEESRLRYHDNRVVSSGTVSMDTFESIAAASEVFKTVHACLMIGAWICAASCGIILARYYKKTWLQNRCCGIDQWFHFHRFFMGLTWGLTVAGFILIVYYLQGWTKIKPKQNPHAILGVITTGLCFIQPFMALCRCSPGHKNRPIFNWLHWFVGNSAQILGITAIFFGFELVDAPEWTTFILIIFIAFHCVVHLILSIGQCVSESKAEQTSNVYPMKDMNGSRSPLQPVEKRTDAPGSGFRKAMLALYFLINWLITAVLILIVVVGEETLKDWGIIFWEK